MIQKSDWKSHEGLENLSSEIFDRCETDGVDSINGQKKVLLFTGKKKVLLFSLMLTAAIQYKNNDPYR